MSQISTQPGTLESLALSNPYVRLPMPFARRGVYLGTEFGNRRRYMTHPWRQQNENQTPATTTLIRGQIKSRKSTIKKTIICRAMGLQAGKVYPDKIRVHPDVQQQLKDRTTHEGAIAMVRIRDHSRKAEDGESEDAPMTRAARGITFNLGKEAVVNPFAMDIGLDQFDHTEIAIIMGQRSSNSTYTPLDVAALGVNVSRMWTRPEAASLPFFGDLLANMTVEDVLADMARARNQRRKLYYQRFKHNPDLHRQIKAMVLQADHALETAKAEEIVARAHELEADFRRIEGADFGPTFCSLDGMSGEKGLLGADFANWYWLGMTASGQGLLEVLQWKWLSAQHLKPELAHLVPTINANDEGASATSSPDYMTMRARSAAITRRFPTWDIEIVQYIGQLIGVGGFGTDQQNNANIIRQTIGTSIVGRVEMTDDQGIADCLQMGFNPAQMRMVHRLKPSQFAEKVTTLTYPNFFTHQVLPEEWGIIKASSANDSMVDTVAFGDQTDPRYTDSGLYLPVGVR